MSRCCWLISAALAASLRAVRPGHRSATEGGKDHSLLAILGPTSLARPAPPAPAGSQRASAQARYHPAAPQHPKLLRRPSLAQRQCAGRSPWTRWQAPPPRPHAGMPCCHNQPWGPAPPGISVSRERTQPCAPPPGPTSSHTPSADSLSWRTSAAVRRGCLQGCGCAVSVPDLDVPGEWSCRPCS